MSEHDPLCEKAWGYPDFLVSRGIKREDCWMCDLLIQAKRDALAGAVARVEALMHYPMNHTTECAWFKSLTNECDCTLSKVIAAIKGDGGTLTQSTSTDGGHNGEEEG